MKVEKWKEGHGGIINCSEWVMKVGTVPARSHWPQNSPGVVKMSFGPSHCSRDWQTDLCGFNYGCHQSQWSKLRSRQIYTGRHWCECAGKSTKIKVTASLSANSVAAVSAAISTNKGWGGDEDNRTCNGQLGIHPWAVNIYSSPSNSLLFPSKCTK